MAVIIVVVSDARFETKGENDHFYSVLIMGGTWAGLFYSLLLTHMHPKFVFDGPFAVAYGGMIMVVLGFFSCTTKKF